MADHDEGDVPFFPTRKRKVGTDGTGEEMKRRKGESESHRHVFAREEDHQGAVSMAPHTVKIQQVIREDFGEGVGGAVAEGVYSLMSSSFSFHAVSVRSRGALAAVDDERQEVSEIWKILFDRKGLPRANDLKEIPRPIKVWINLNAFPSPHLFSGSNDAAEGLLCLLQQLSGIGSWDLITYCPDWRWDFLIGGETDRERKEERVREAREKDALPFFVVGFREVTDNLSNLPVLFATPEMIHPISAESFSRSLMRKRRGPKIVGINKEMSDFAVVHTSSMPPAPFLTQIVLFLTNGASLSHSSVLHSCALAQRVDLLEILLGIDGNALESRDEMLATPLMCAAVGAAGQRTATSPPPTQTVAFLLNKGASRSARNVDGKSAYDLVERERQSGLDSCAALGWPPTSFASLQCLFDLLAIPDSLLCVACNKSLLTSQTTASSNPLIGYRCSECDNEMIWCDDCWMAASGSFCGGLCKRFFCSKCCPKFILDDFGEMYCDVACAPTSGMLDEISSLF
jgi:hypothetical protein